MSKRSRRTSAAARPSGNRPSGNRPSVAARPSGPRRPPATPSATPSRRLPGWLIGAAALGILALVAVALVLGNPGPGSAGQASPTAGPSASPSGPSSTPVSPGSAAASQGLAGLRSDPPPWAPETANLRVRLQAIGLPALSAEGTALHIHQHLDIVIDGQPVPVPADIGINVSAGFLAEIHTHDATGIIHVESPELRTFILGQFFDIWGIRFDSHCIGGSCDGNGRTLAVFVNGAPASGDPRAIALESGQEILVTLGTPAQLPSPLPSSYPFPQGL